MNFSKIKKYDIANGDGVRISLFVSGCRNCCEGCFNPETWDFNAGEKFTKKTINEIIDFAKYEHISGLSILGGEPMEEENQKYVWKLIKTFRKKFKDEKDIWLWTGYNYEMLADGKIKKTMWTKKILKNIDVIVDGKFEIDKKNISLKYRGSENQRVIKLRR